MTARTWVRPRSFMPGPVQLTAAWPDRSRGGSLYRAGLASTARRSQHGPVV